MDRNGDVSYPSLEIDLSEGVPKGSSGPKFSTNRLRQTSKEVEILLLLVVISTGRTVSPPDTGY